MTMRTFLDRFYDYVKSPEGFNCVEFQYEGIIYQVVAGANISYVDNQGNKHRIDLPDDIEVILDTKIGREGSEKILLFMKHLPVIVIDLIFGNESPVSAAGRNHRKLVDSQTVKEQSRIIE